MTFKLFIRFAASSMFVSNETNDIISKINVNSLKISIITNLKSSISELSFSDDKPDSPTPFKASSGAGYRILFKTEFKILTKIIFPLFQHYSNFF